MAKILKKDMSPKVPQRDKLKQELTIRTRDDLTDTQKQIIEAALDKNVKCVIIDGVSGAGKSYTTILAGLKLLSAKRMGQMIYVRSAIQAKDGEVGFLAGDLTEKMQHYNYPLFQALEELLPENEVKLLLNDKRVLTFPTSMLRSYNFHNSFIISEESQNMSFDSLFTIATRAGMYSKLFIIGDSVHQNDLGKHSGFLKFASLFNDQESIDNGFRYFKLDSKDIVRSPFVKFVVEKVEKSIKK